MAFKISYKSLIKRSSQVNFVLSFSISLMTSIACVHRKSITSEVTSYGSLSVDSNQLKLGVLWSASDKISIEEKMILNHIAEKIVDEARFRGIETFLVKTDEDYSKVKSEGAYLAIPSFSVDETSTYVPPSTYSIYTPQTEYHSGSISSPGLLNSYQYSGTTTTQKKEEITTGGYTITRFCRKVFISYLTYEELSKEKPETSYLQKIISCGKNNDIRFVIGEMLESSFNSLGKSGQFNETIYLEEPRNSRKRYGK